MYRQGSYHRPQFPQFPARPLPAPKPKAETATLLFERVTSHIQAQHEQQRQLAANATQPTGWHHYHPTPPMSPTGSMHAGVHQTPSSMSVALPRTPSGSNIANYRNRSNSSIATSATLQHPESRPETPFASPYPPPAPVPTVTQKLSSVEPFSSGSTSTIFRTVIKRPQVQQVYINDELLSNAPDVEAQYLAELRVFQTSGPHKNIVAFLGCLEGVGMVLEYVEGETLYERVIKKSAVEKHGLVTPRLKVEWFNQIVDALVHIHKHGLSHGDLNTLNVLISHPTAHPPNCIKLLDFGRSTFYSPPGFTASLPPSETPQPCSHPFAAPEVLRGGRWLNRDTRQRLPVDGRLADAYSLGILLWFLDEEKLIPIDQQVQKREEVDIYAQFLAAEENSVWNYSEDEDDGERADEEDEGDDEEMKPIDEGYYSGANGEGAKKRFFLATSSRRSSSRSRSQTRSNSQSRTSRRKRRLFTTLIQGYLKKWEQRTKVSLDQRIPLSGEI